MKIRINYDLLEKIEEAKKGFSLKRDIKTIGTTSFFNIVPTFTIAIFEPIALKIILVRIPFVISFHTMFRGVINLLIGDINKKEANTTLDNLAITLQSLNINTNRELLLNSYKYKTTYKLQKTQKAIPCIKREKYIMVPTNDIYEEEASLLEEHIMGTRKYDLSKGEPQKVLKLAKQFA